MTSIGSSIGTSLGIGSGIDTGALVSDLVSAVRDPKQKVLSDRANLNNARISALASASASLDTFADALNNLLSGSGYSGTPVSNDPGIASVSLLPGGEITGLPAQLRVQQLASAQTLASTPAAGKVASDTVGLGKLMLSVNGGTAVAIEVTAANNSYTGLAKAINDSNAGVTASVVTDNQGTRLVIKGATGEASDFTLVNAPNADGDDQLGAFAWNGADSGTMKRQAVAQDSIIVLDGVEQRYSSNTIDTAIANLRIDLNKAAPGTDISLTKSEPTTTIRDLLVEFVEAYNTLMKGLNTATAAGADATTAGVLAGDSSARDMKRQLSQLTSAAMGTSGTYKSLADIGVATNRDGTLKLDTEALDRAIAANPAAITQMLNPAVSTTTNPGLAGLMDGVRDRIQMKDGALSSAQAKYKELGESLTEQLEKLDVQMENYEAQLTSVYSKMQSRLTALKATQSYLDQQIAAWNSSDD
jgi:flagellar hook-associated protein 2